MIKPLSELVEPGWAHALADVEPTIHHMGDFLRAENAAGRPWLPASHNILRAFTIPFDSIKVLIVGQDPYPTPGHPVGLSFCVAPNVHPLPKSLVNIYKELVDDLGVPMPTNGDLTPWGDVAQQMSDCRRRAAKFASGQRLGGSHRGRDSCVERAHGRRRQAPAAGGDSLGA